MDFDNLKFQAIKSQDSVVITTETRMGDKFMGMITDFDKVQKPSSILKHEICEEKILKNIRETTYVYKMSYENDVIHVVIPLMGEYVAHCELNRVEQELKSQLDENNIIEKIVWKISEKLEPYEVIETFEYPSWECYPDFEDKSKHENYRYFEAVKDWRKYLICFHTQEPPIGNMSYYHLGKFVNTFVNIHGIHSGTFDRFLNTDMFDINGKHINTFSEFKEQYETNATNLEKMRNTFAESCHKYVQEYNNGGIELNNRLLYYIYEVVKGWILMNFSCVCLREPKVSIEIDEDKVLFRIHRLKKSVFKKRYSTEYRDKYGCSNTTTENVCGNNGKEKKILYLMQKIPLSLTVEGVEFEN